MKLLAGKEILAADDSSTQAVKIPEWSGSVHIRTMTGAERDSFEADILAEQGQTMRNIRAKLAVRCLCDADGNRLFEDSDADALGAKSAAALDRIFAVAARLNRVGADDVEALVKNSASGQSAAHGSD